MGSSECSARADTRARAGKRSSARIDRARLQTSRCAQGSARFAAEGRRQISRRTSQARAQENSGRKMIADCRAFVSNAFPMRRLTEWSRWAPSDIDGKLERASERVRTSQMSYKFGVGRWAL